MSTVINIKKRSPARAAIPTPPTSHQEFKWSFVSLYSVLDSMSMCMSCLNLDVHEMLLVVFSPALSGVVCKLAACRQSFASVLSSDLRLWTLLVIFVVIFLLFLLLHSRLLLLLFFFLLYRLPLPHVDGGTEERCRASR